MQAMPKHAYRTLNTSTREIRVFKITSVQPIRGSFEYVSLDDEPGYDAISWRWGDPSITATIGVEDSTISIPSNALDVITGLCIRHNKLRIWLDAVCINQHDNEERSQQVAIMSDIYMHARQTLVWLGPDDGTTEAAIACVEHLNNWRKIQHTDGAIDKGVWSDTPVDEAFPLDTDWNAVLSLFSPGWYSRFWIIQEVAFSSRTIIFRGRHFIQWSLLSVVAHYLVLNSFLLKALVDKDTHRNGINGVYNAQSIARVADADIFLLERQLRFEATDPRDRAFALYGLLGVNPKHATLRQAFQPNYLKSLPQVYIEITRAALRETQGGILLLQSAQRLVPRPNVAEVEDSFPSWVPRYDYIEDVERGSYNAVKDHSHTNSLHDLQCDFNTADTVLRIKGVIVSEVEELVPAIQPGDFPLTSEGVLDKLASLWDITLRLNPHTPEYELAAMVRITLTACVQQSVDHVRQFRAFVNRFWPEPKPPYDTDGLAYNDVDDDMNFNSDEDDLEEMTFDLEAPGDESHELLQACLSSDSDDQDFDDVDEDSKNAMMFYDDMLESTINRPFVFDREGRIGSAGRQAEIGDKICILYGLPVPVLLRPAGDAFSFVSDLHLSGVMQGEYITTLAEEGSLEQWFDIV